MARTIGAIGFGNMGAAILKGLSSRLDKNFWNLTAYNPSRNKFKDVEQFGIIPANTVVDLVTDADIIVLAVKPDKVADVLNTIAPYLNTGKILVSVAAGISLSALRDCAGSYCQIARCMPTTTALAGHGIFALCFDSINYSDALKEEITGLFQNLGLCVDLPESRFTDFSALIGAGPAYIFAMMQGLAQAGVTLGFSQALARQMLIELVIGSGELAKIENKNFSQLRDDVCSPGGLTIAGINILDRAGFSGLLVEAVEAAQKRGRQMEV